MLAPDLHVHSTFSVMDGFGTPEQIVLRAKALGWKACAITEHGWMGSAVPFYQACIKHEIKPIIGTELYVVPDDALGEKGTEFRKVSNHLTVLAINQAGYQALVRINSFANDPANFYYKPRISIETMFDLISEDELDGLVVLSGCLGSALNQSILTANGNALAAGQGYVTAMSGLFPNFFIELQVHEKRKFLGKGFTAYEDMCKREAAVRGVLTKISKMTGVPVVLTNDSHFQHPSQRNAHLAMRASAWRTRDDTHYGTSEATRIESYLGDYVYFSSYLQSMERIADGIELGAEALGNACAIAEEADVRIGPLDDFKYSLPFSGYDDPVAQIRIRCKARLARLVKAHGKGARERFEFELESMGGFEHYLLLMSDFIIAANKQGILTNTRGSAANSLLCYALKIHNIDPIQYGLLFERFYNPSRKKVPDIDIDIEKHRHADFIRIVTERMRELEGEGQVVPICELGTLANRASFRAAAEALGMSKDKQDEVSNLLPQMIDSGMVDEASDVYAALKEEYPDLYEMASGIFDSVRSIGPHPCGWLFGTKDRPISDWIPLYWVASQGTKVAQFNMKALDDFGLVKGDFLRLRTLSAIKRTLILIGQDSLSLESIPLSDPETYEMLRKGRTEGVFTIQGKANRQGCIECEVETVHDLIRSVAIYRPALTRPGYHNVFNNRRRGKEKVEYPHEIAERVLGDTFGMPVFQEQILEMCYGIGMNDLEAEDFLKAIKLAKGVGRGAKEAFKNLEPMFFKKAGKMMTQEEASGLWDLVTSFQAYGFNKGHATSYGALADRHAYLKCHHPSAFYAGILDVFPEKSRYVASARSEGFKFVPPCVNRSSAGFTPANPGVDDKQIRVGLARIKGLGPVAIRAIVEGQPFASFDDFKERIPASAVDTTQLERLATLGAFDCVGIEGSSDDLDEFQLLGFTLEKPAIFRDCKPRFAGARSSESGWRHVGLEKGVELTPYKSSVSKLFWIPDTDILLQRGYPSKQVGGLLQLKASAWANAKSWLLTALDTNGIAFQISIPEDKQLAKVLKFLASRCRGSVVCLDGAVKQSFLQDGPMQFRLYSVTGARRGASQIWKVEKPVYAKSIDELHRRGA